MGRDTVAAKYEIVAGGGLDAATLRVTGRAYRLVATAVIQDLKDVAPQLAVGLIAAVIINAPPAVLVPATDLSHSA